MSPHPCPPLACPLCAQPLERQANSYRCAANHHFDIARQGHVNLLPVQYKRSRDPGDSKAMIDARSRFLDAGYYRPVSDTLNRLILEQTSTDIPLSLLDAGSGEGWYLEQLLPHLPADSCLMGMDISKWAVQAATRRSRTIHWLVGTNRKPPLLPASLDLLLCLFGFQQWEAFKPLLKPGGRILLADSGPDHLIELRRIIYPEVKHKPVAELRGLAEHGLEELDQHTLRFTTPPIPREHLADLLVMTPHLYRASTEGREAALALEQLELTVEVCFRWVGEPV